MKARIYIKHENRGDIPHQNETFNSLSKAVESLPEGYTTARYGWETLAIIPFGHDFTKERYGEIGYIYTGSAA